MAWWSPLEGTPAYRAGIRSKDTIVQIENESTVNMDLIEAVGKLRGDPGTSVTIGIMREGLAEPKEITIVRELINIHAVVDEHHQGGAALGPPPPGVGGLAVGVVGADGDHDGPPIDELVGYGHGLVKEAAGVVAQVEHQPLQILIVLFDQFIQLQTSDGDKWLPTTHTIAQLNENRLNLPIDARSRLGHLVHIKPDLARRTEGVWRQSFFDGCRLNSIDAPDHLSTLRNASS